MERIWYAVATCPADRRHNSRSVFTVCSGEYDSWLAGYKVAVALSKGVPQFYPPFDRPVFAPTDGFVVILDDQKRLTGRVIIATFTL